MIDDSEIMCDEIIEETRTILTNFNEINAICKARYFYILLAFSLITIALLIAISIYFCPMKYKAKQNIYYRLTSQITN